MASPLNRIDYRSPYSYVSLFNGVNVNASDSGDNTVVSGVAGKIIVVTSYMIVASGAVTVTWESEGGRVLSGPTALAANGGMLLPLADQGHFHTDAGEDLILNLSGATQVGGHINYFLF